MLRLHRLIGCAVLLLATASLAAPGDRADQLFREGRQAYIRGDFKTAASDQAAAWKLRKSFDIAANLGQAELKLKQYRDAAEHLRYALDHFPASLNARAKDRLTRTFDAARAQVAELTLQVTPSGAQISVDKQPAGAAPLSEPVYLEPGMHEVRAELQGYTAEQRAFAVRAGESQAVTLALKPAPAAAPSKAAPAPPPAAAPKPAPDTPPPAAGEGHGIAPRTIALITGAGLTAVSLGVGIGFAVDSSSASSDASSLRAQAISEVGKNGCATDPSAPVCASLRDANDHAGRSRTIATLGFVGAGVFAAATVATFFLWHPRAKHEAAAPPAFELYPAIGATSGLVARGRF